MRYCFSTVARKLMVGMNVRVLAPLRTNVIPYLAGQENSHTPFRLCFSTIAFCGSAKDDLLRLQEVLALASQGLKAPTIANELQKE